MPILEPELDLHSPALPHDEPRQFTSLSVDLKEHHFVLRPGWSRQGILLWIRILRVLGPVRRPFYPAPQHCIIFTQRTLVRNKVHVRAYTRHLHLASQQRQRRPPVRTLFCRNASSRPIRWHIEPRRLPIDQKQILLRRLVLPSHLSRSPKKCRPRLRSHHRAVLRISLQESRLQRLRRPVMGLKSF